MNHQIRQLLILSFCIALLSACSVSKYIPSDKNLYVGADIEFTSKKELQEEEQLTNSINSSLYPKPNNKFLGFFYFRLWVYFVYQNDHNKGLKKWLFEQFAEEPVYQDDVNQPLLEDIIKKNMQDYGHFNSKVESKAIIKNDKASVLFTITPTGVTVIDTVVRPAGNTELDSLVRNYPALKLRKGQTYKLSDFNLERIRLAESIRSQGYYEFDIEDIFYLVDTSKVKKVDIFMQLNSPENDSIFRKFYINKIEIYTTNGSSFGSKMKDANTQYQYKGINIYEDYTFIDKKTLVDNVLIEKYSKFNVRDYNLTLSRLINLNVFKYVNIEYKKAGKDSLNVEILLTPSLYKGLQYDLEATTSDRSFLGSTLTASFFNNNSFRKAERFSASLGTGAELQYINGTPRFAIFNGNVKLRYEIPRLLIPFKTTKFRALQPPKTFMSIEEDFQLWIRYFTMNSVNINYGYEWRPDNKVSYSFQPLFVNLVNVFRTTAEFDSIIAERPFVALSYQNNLLIGSLFSATYNTKRRSTQMNYANLRASFETAGNTSSLVAKVLTNNQQTYKIFNVPISQYFRTDIDLRLTRDFNSKLSWVSRINIGFVKPYGNSITAPFTKQFFMGGPTTLRGFEYRSVGPGRYKANANAGFANPLDQSGEIKILLNTEYRFPIYSIFRGAFFVDAGNVWLFKPDDSRPESTFSFNNFYKELALNSGVGLRIDIDILAFRIDFGFPLYEPYQQVGMRWFNDGSAMGIGNWLVNKAVISAGIGYPF